MNDSLNSSVPLEVIQRYEIKSLKKQLEKSKVYSGTLESAIHGYKHNFDKKVKLAVSRKIKNDINNTEDVIIKSLKNEIHILKTPNFNDNPYVNLLLNNRAELIHDKKVLKNSLKACLSEINRLKRLSFEKDKLNLSLKKDLIKYEKE